jgi:hypothetical protein
MLKNTSKIGKTTVDKEYKGKIIFFPGNEGGKRISFTIVRAGNYSQ